MGMAVAHGMASGMNGMRTAGDLVMRMEMKGMKIKEAKEYVAGKLGVGVPELSDEYRMKEVREELDIGTVMAVPGAAKGLRAKARIADILGIEIPCVEKLR